MLQNYKTFLSENYPKFKKAFPKISIKRDLLFAVFVAGAIVSLVIAIVGFVLLAYLTFELDRTQNVIVARWWSFAIVIFFLMLLVIHVILAYYRARKIKYALEADSDDDILTKLYSLERLRYKGRNYKQNIWWVKDSIQLSPMTEDKSLTFAYTPVYKNTDINNIDKWKIQGVQIRAKDRSESYLFLEGQIRSRDFKQSYLIGPKFPHNLEFDFDPEIKYHMNQSYDLMSNENKLNLDGYRILEEYIDTYDLWNRGYGFYIDSKTKKVYSWIKLSKELFKWKDQAHAEENLLRDIFLIEMLETLPLVLN